jgi:hypothetical protein
MYFGPELVPLTLNLGGHARQVNLMVNPGCPMEARSNFASEARYVDPLVSLKHHQRERLAEVKAAALRLEQDLLGQKRGREEALEASDENLPAV